MLLREVRGMANFKKHFKTKKDVFIFLLMILTAVMITVTGIVFGQNFLRILPLYISLIIGMLQSRVNRFASLIGSFNSLLYAAVYFYYSLYGAALSALVFSFPVQFLTFIRWNKNKDGQSTVLRRMNFRTRIIVAAASIASVVTMWIVLPLFGSQYVFLDSVSTMIGILIYFLTMFAFTEYTVFMVINCAITIVLHAQMLFDTPETAPFFVFSIYSFICVAFSVFEAGRLYKEQQKERTTVSNAESQ